MESTRGFACTILHYIHDYLLSAYSDENQKREVIVKSQTSSDSQEFVEYSNCFLQ